jgi:hypothetical protein
MFRLSGTELLLSLTYHPQTDGQIEVMNNELEGYLRSFLGDRPRDKGSTQSQILRVAEMD